MENEDNYQPVEQPVVGNVVFRGMDSAQILATLDRMEALLGQIFMLVQHKKRTPLDRDAKSLAVCDMVRDLWAKHCPNNPQPDRLGSHLQSVILRRYDEGFDFERHFKRVAESPFLTGRTKEKWQADLLWVLNPGAIERIELGRYDGRVENGGNQYQELGSGV